MRRFCRWCVLTALLCGLSAPGFAEHTRLIDDGPYVRREGDTWLAEWVCAGKVVRRTLDTMQWPVTIPAICGYSQPIALPAPDAPPPGSIVAMPERLVAVSDIHGQYELLLQLLQANDVIDPHLHWRYGDGVLVVNGDVFDRGAKVTETFWLLHQLQQQAQAVGGDVWVLPGNHEAMVLSGNLRYIHAKYQQVAELLGRSYSALYDADSLIGHWLRQQPVMVRIGDTLFVHAGIAPEYFDLGLEQAALNARYRESLGTPKDVWEQDPLLSGLYNSKTSPLWYRGYFDGRLDTPSVAAIVQRLGVKRIVVGHTSKDEIGSYHHGRVIAIDSSIKRGKSGELLLIEQGTLSRGTLAGQRRPLREHEPAPP